jgi:hypothetical protein
MSKLITQREAEEFLKKHYIASCNAAIIGGVARKGWSTHDVDYYFECPDKLMSELEDEIHRLIWDVFETTDFNCHIYIKAKDGCYGRAKGMGTDMDCEWLDSFIKEHKSEGGFKRVY